MIIALYLILGHLLGDFVFQTNKIFAWKHKNFKGTLAHVLVHFLVTNILLFPVYLAKTYWPLVITAIIALFHFIIDQLKLSYDKKHPKASKTPAFLFDQFLHFLIIAAFYPTIQSTNIFIPDNFFNRLYASPEIPLFLSFGIIVTFAYDIYLHQKKLKKNKNAKLTFYSEKWPKRLTLLLLLLILSSFFQI